MKKLVDLLVSWLLVIEWLQGISGSHFRGGSISFRPLKRTGQLVYGQFHTSFSWRRGYGTMTSCDQTTIDEQALFGPILDITCEVGCDTPSQVIGNTSIICTSFSLQDDWSFGQNSFECVLKPDTYYEVSFIGGYWVELVLQGDLFDLSANFRRVFIQFYTN